MAKMDTKELKERYAASKSEHDLFMAEYEPVYHYGLPSRYGAMARGRYSPNATTRGDVFTDAFEQAVREGSKTIQSFLFPPSEDWIGLEAGSMFDRAPKARKDAVNRELEKVADIMNLFKGVSNFDQSAAQFCDDLMVGHGFMAKLDGTYERPVNNVCIPFCDITRDVDAFGNSRAYWRELEYKNEDVKRVWLDAQYSYGNEKATDKRKFLECTYHDYDEDMWRYAVICLGSKDESPSGQVIVERSTITSPIMDLPWEISPGETYGRGLALSACIGARRLNKLNEFSLRNLAFNIPMFMVADDSVDLAKFRPYPGAGLRVKSNASTSPSIAPLQLGTRDQNLEHYHMDKLEMDLRRNTGASSLPNQPMPGEKMTAYEVGARLSELSRFQYTDYGRMMGFIESGIRRDLEIYQRFGYVGGDIDVRSLNGFGFRAKVHTRLARMQKNGDYENMLRAIQLEIQLGGDPNRRFHLDDMASDFYSGIGVQKKYIRTAEERAAYDEAIAEAQAKSMAAGAEMDVEVSNAKEQGKQEAISNARP